MRAKNAIPLIACTVGSHASAPRNDQEQKHGGLAIVKTGVVPTTLTVNRLDGEICGAELFVGPYHWPLPYAPVHQGQVELFLRPWEMALSEKPTARCPLPVQIIDVSPRGHYWQLVVQPLGWHPQPLTVVAATESAGTPARGDRRYFGGQNARLYTGDKALQPIAFAESA